VSNKYNATLVKNRKVEEDFSDIPNFLAVSLKIIDIEFAIVGVRFFGEPNHKKSQFIQFLSLINNFKKVVVCGDFNNEKIRGKENVIYSEEQIDIIYAKYRQFEYNYHRIKLWFEQNKFFLITPAERVSYKYEKPYKGGSKIDHFAVKGVRISNVIYLETNKSDHNQLLGEIEF